MTDANVTACWICACRQGDLKEKDGAVEAEDRVTIDFTGSVNGEEFEGGKASNYQAPMAMGQGSCVIQGFRRTVSKATKLAKSSAID
ncbi:FKBP-type peptidyl-prolyl cis-trans isomerase [Escherichia coli]